MSSAAVPAAVPPPLLLLRPWQLLVPASTLRARPSLQLLPAHQLSCIRPAPLHAPLQLYNGSTNPYFLAARRLYDQFWGVLRSSILPSLEAAGIVEPKL